MVSSQNQISQLFTLVGQMQTNWSTQMLTGFVSKICYSKLAKSLKKNSESHDPCLTVCV